TILICLFYFYYLPPRPSRTSLFPLHDALPIFKIDVELQNELDDLDDDEIEQVLNPEDVDDDDFNDNDDSVIRKGDEESGETDDRSEEHTSELQSRFDLVCRLLLEKKK